MAAQWTAWAVLVDERGNRSRVTWPLQVTGGTVVEFTAALDAQGELHDALVLITSANVQSTGISFIQAEDNSLGAAGSDVTDILELSVHIEDTGDLPKLATLNVPSPVNGVFLPDLKTFDLTDVDTQAYVTQHAAYATISDGEEINTAAGTNGVESGMWVSRKRR